MKYVNQINIALAAVAVVAVALAFGQTYLSSEPPPSYSPVDSGLPSAPAETGGVEEEGAATAAPATTPADPAALNPPRTVDSNGRVSPTGNPTPTGPSPSIGRRLTSPANTTNRQPARQVDADRRPQAPLAPSPTSREAQRRGPGSRPTLQPSDDDPGAEEASPSGLPRRPEARRDANRRVNPAPPPARSSMPEQRPQR